MAGHSKWANIKHRKARQDAKRGKAWSKCSKAIMVAAKAGGGDPDANLGLRYAIEEAKTHNMPKDTIENAIRKGTGDLGDVVFEQIMYEGYGAGGVAVMVDALTDNRNRTAPEMRKLFEKAGGNLGATGCVSYSFQKRGQIFIDGEGLEEEKVMEAALEAGAEDVVGEDGAYQIVTDPTEFLTVKAALEAAGFTLASAEVTMIPDATVACEGKDAEKVARLIDALEDHDDVQKVYTNADLPEDVL